MNLYRYIGIRKKVAPDQMIVLATASNLLAGPPPVLAPAPGLRCFN